MILRLKHYDQEYHIASFCKTINTLKEMLSKNYNIAFLLNNKLYFFPQCFEIVIEDNELNAISEIEEYSILQFQKNCAFVYYDSSSNDNAIFITNKCNSNCIMCPTSSLIRKESEIESIHTLLKICKQIPQPSSHITITGGEPFLLKEDIFQLFNYLKENMNDTEYLLLTNGRAFADKKYYSKFIEVVPSNMLIGIPIHGYDSKTHDLITRAPGSFNQTVIGIKRLLQAKVKIELRIVVSKLNSDFIDKIVDMIIQELNGVYTIKIIGLEMLGNARQNIDDVWIDYKTSFSLIKNDVKKLIVNGFDLAIYNYPLCCVDKAYWSICEKSITKDKIRFLEECNYCTRRDACGGMFFGTYKLMEGIVERIK